MAPRGSSEFGSAWAALCRGRQCPQALLTPPPLPAAAPQQPAAVVRTTLLSTRDRSPEAAHQVAPQPWAGQPRAWHLPLCSSPLPSVRGPGLWEGPPPRPTAGDQGSLGLW